TFISGCAQQPHRVRDIAEDQLTAAFKRAGPAKFAFDQRAGQVEWRSGDEAWYGLAIFDGESSRYVVASFRVNFPWTLAGATLTRPSIDESGHYRSTHEAIKRVDTTATVYQSGVAQAPTEVSAVADAPTDFIQSVAALRAYLQ